jgi:hypothetical protein
MYCSQHCLPGYLNSELNFTMVFLCYKGQSPFRITYQVPMLQEERGLGISRGVSLFQINDVMCYSCRSRDSAVGITTGYGLDDRRVGVRVPVMSRTFSSQCHPDRIWGPSSLPFNGTGAFSPGGVKRAAREADHSPSTRAEIKKTLVYISTPPYVFMA